MELDRTMHGDGGAPCSWGGEAAGRDAREGASSARSAAGRTMKPVELHPADRAWLWSVVARCCPEPAEREDLLQEVMIRLSKHADAHALAVRHRPWLRSVALNCWRDHVRRMRRLPACEAGDEVLDAVEGGEPVPGELPEEAQWIFDGLRVSQSTAMRAVQRALGQLCPADRSALRKHYGLGTGEGAAEGPPAGRCRLHRARARLVARLRPALLVERAAEGP